MSAYKSLIIITECSLAENLTNNVTRHFSQFVAKNLLILELY